MSAYCFQPGASCFMRILANARASIEAFDVSIWSPTACLCVMGLQYRRRSGTWSCAFPSTCGDQTHCPRLRCGSCRNEHQGASVSTDSRSVSTDAHALGLTPVHDGLAFVSRKLATARVPIRTVPLRQPRHARCNRLITADRLQTRAHVLHHLSGASAHPYGCSGTPRMREVSGYF